MAKFWIAAMLITLSQSIAEQPVVTPTKVQFFDGYIEDAQKKAQQEGKLYFVDFVAKWCQPCKWMDETTYQDEPLAKFINENFVPVKIDVDKLDYYHYQDFYDIKLLPTIIVFNADGELLGRFEESMSPSKMTQILSQYNIPENKGSGKTAPIASVEPPKEELSNVGTQRPDVPAEYSYETEAPKVDYPEYQVQEPNLEESTASIGDTPHIEKPKPRVEVQEPVMPNVSINDGPNPATTSSDATAGIAETTDNDEVKEQKLYRFKLSEQASDGFSIQVGAFSEQNNVLAEVERLQLIFIDQPIIVHKAQYKGRLIFKILIGEFEKRSDATLFMNIVMKKQGISGVVKDLSVLKK